MMCRLVLYFEILTLVFAVANSARILGVFPVPSISHQVVFRALTVELAKRGHEVVVITTDPAFPKSKPPHNMTEIDISFSYEVIAKIEQKNFEHTRGVMMEAEKMAMIEVYTNLVDLVVLQMDHPDIKKLIENKNQKFDLIIAESFINYQLCLSHIFKAPVILVSSLHAMPLNYEAVGTISRHPVFYPNILRQNFGDLSLFAKIKELHIEYKFMDTEIKLEEYENKRLKERFGPDSPTIRDLYNSIEFLLINSNEVFCNNRPLPSNAAYVGPLHLQPLKELPEDIKTYLDNSETGVIYVSLGTNVRPSLMDADLLNAFLYAFEVLPYDILWKFDGDNLKRASKNLKIQKWFPQRDLLAHPKIKLFVTQGGLQSSDEAIDAGVPMVYIPMLGDQFYNAYKFEELGLGVKLDTLTLDAESLLAGINNVLNDINRYRENVKKLRDIIYDQPQSPIERAVWWAEYVIRHKGAKHLRSPIANTTWAEYLMLDVVAAMASAVIVSLIVVILSLKYIVSLILSKKRKQKVKSS